MAKINEDAVIYNTRPAENGTRDASVVGNGKVWATVLGRKGNEEITLYRTDLMHGGYTGVLQDVSDKFPTVRKLYAEGKILDAGALLEKEFAKKGYRPLVDKPLALPTLCIDFKNEGYVTDYRRTTDMKSGEVEVAFKHGGTAQNRRACVGGSTNDIFAYTATGKINATVSFKVQGVQNNVALVTSGEYTNFAARSASGLDYGFVARVINGAESLAVYIKTFNDSNRDVEFKKLKNELDGMKSYDKIFSSGSAAHEKAFNSYSLSLGAPNTASRDFASLLGNAGNGEVESATISRMWNLGKYLTICGASTGDISFFNSAQLLYCGSMSDILQDIVLKLFDYYEKYIDDLKKNAARVYGMRGYFVPNAVSPKSALFGAVDAGTVHFIASSALAANIFYRYYQMTGDVKTLKAKIFPFMREVCNFYSDFLKLDPSGYYTTIPSYSPKSTPGNTIAGKPLENFGFAVNSTIDFLAIEALLNNLIEAAGVCGTGDVTMWKDMKTKLPPLAVNGQGCLREYTNCAFIDRAQNLGTMHAYGLWPMKTISFNDKTVVYKPDLVVGGASKEQTISLRRASFNAVVARLKASWHLQDARSLAIAMLQSTHSGLGMATVDFVRELCLRFLTSTTSESGLCLDTDWRGGGSTRNGSGEFDVVGNVGFTNAITECIVQSDSRNLRILPVIFDALNVGTINDVTTDFAARVSVDWDVQKKKCVVKITPKVTCKINIEVNKHFRKVKSKDLQMNNELNGLRDFQLTANKSVTLEFM